MGERADPRRHSPRPQSRPPPSPPSPSAALPLPLRVRPARYLLSQARMVSPRLSRKTIMWPCRGSSNSGAGGSVWPRATRPRARARRRPVTWMTCGQRVRLEEGRVGGQAPAVTRRAGRGAGPAGVRELPGRRGRGQRLCGELTPTLYPEALTCRPRLVRVDFMRTKKERSWAREEGGTSVGLASGRSEGELWGPEEETHGGAPSPPPSERARGPPT